MITVERLRDVLSYDQETGLWTWLKPTGSRVSAGQLAGRKGGNGYWAIGIDGGRYPVTRLAFLYMNGHWPQYRVDHVDQNPDNNRWSNLREATPAQNSANRGKQKNNTSGYKGVTWDKRDRKWVAQIYSNGRHISLGYFADPAEANSAYKVAAEKYFGAFANAG